jgi:CRISPR-associated protein Cas2
MHLLIPYDIADDKRRRIIEKILASHGRRVNYSVFEVETSKAKYRKIIKALEANSDKQHDHIRIYILNKESLKKSFVLHSDEGVFEHEALYL